MAEKKFKIFGVGKKIKLVRVEKGWTQKELASKIGIKRYQTIGRWENGETLPSPADLQSIASATDKPLSSFLPDESSYPPEAIPVKDFIKVPLLGHVPAGPKAFVSDEVEQWLSLPKELARGKRLYLLRVTGDSMNLAGIKPGCLVAVDADAEPQNGNIVIIRVNDEATIKRFKKYENVIILTPESSNPVHKEESYTKKDDIQLRGVVKGIWGL